MPTLQSALSRLGAARLAELSGSTTIKLLEALDVHNLAPNRLADLVLRQFGAERLLLNTTLRRELLAALQHDDAERLCRLIDIDEDQPWDNLDAVRFQKGQARTNVLFEFFSEIPPGGNEEREPPNIEEINPSYPLFTHQIQTYNDVLRYLYSEKPRAFLHMPTGAGKTRTALNLVCEILRNAHSGKSVVIWLAHSEELCDQAADEFTQAWKSLGNRSISVFKHYSGHRISLDSAHDGFIVAGLQLLYRDSLEQQTPFLELGRRVRLVIMDEAHQATAPTYNHLLRLLAPSQTTSILGLSATPGRSFLDADEDIRLAEFFYRQKVTIRTPAGENVIDFLQKQGFLAKVTYKNLHYLQSTDIQLTSGEIDELRQGFDVPERVIRLLATDEKRNLLILTHIIAEAKEGSQIIVFGCSVEHAQLLADILRLKGISSGSVTGATPPDLRRNLIRRFRERDNLQVLTNFGVLTTGFDAPKTNVAVVTRPTQSLVLYSQMVGRVLRGPRAGGNEGCKVLTVLDQLPGFRSASEGFGFWEDIWN